MGATTNNIRFDVDLSERDVQALSSADALAAFFAGLGYDTNARIVQTPGNLGIGTEGILRPIKRIELISDREGLFQVYLFELASVTVAHTRALARAFRNRAGNFLLVLTSDYDRVDFVVLERFLPPAAPGGTIGERQVGIRPRTLTVERRNPDRRTLRVLKRLTWTESDGFAQHDKLIAAYSVADWSEEHFNNRALFSDYYLLERLREFPEWREDPKPAYSALRTLYLGTFERFARKPVAELKKGLVEPALAAFGFEPRGGKAAASHETPDYLLHTPRGRDPLASLLVYPWARSLDGKDAERDSETSDENPGAIVVSLLEKNEVPWVIVTNGRLWRLYARQTHSRASNYYELDAEELLADTGTPLADPGEAFRYFWLLFRRQAFEKHPAQREGKTQDLSLLDRLLLESEDYARDLGSRLKDRVFEEVFPHLAHGFVEHVRAQSGAKAVPQAELDTIYQGTLTLLYRLLFLLYAEARDLLPVREVRGFWEASLVRMKKEIAEHAEDIEDQVEGRLKKAYRDDAYSLWERLQRLFAIVDHGEAALNVPFYNGGLFLTKPDAGDDTPEAVAARFLATHKVADRDLARALDLMSRTVDEKRHSLVFIDYKSLGVRQLGSIYEGLLEFKVCIAQEKLGIKKEKGREVYAAFSKLEEKAQAKAERAGRVVEKGAVYLENDKRERKASGSYYTPDYIVEYIIEHAVGPMLAEKFDKMRPKLRKAQAEHKSFFERQKALAAKRIAPEPVEKAERIGEELVDELFDIKVLDPAMGSGHFLVEAVDFITDRMLTFLNAFPWNPVQAYLARMRDAILVEGESQGVTLDPAKLTDVNLLKRHVLKRCIYGVDLNPMAVELAKVSLWLDCFTLGAPLSFLDHHLRCGNSLIGITEKQFEESQKRWGQMDLLGGSQYAGAKMAVGAMIEVGRLADITPSQIKDSRRHYSIASEALAPIKRLFDVYTSQWFGNAPRKARHGKHTTELNPALDFLRDPLCTAWSQKTTTANLPDHFREIADIALAASATKRFFHWELEFPEVFFGPRPGTVQHVERLEHAGFDAVVGNPPYVRVQEIRQFDSTFAEFLSGRYASAVKNFDIYLPFFELGWQITSGRVSYIAPNKWFATDYGEGLRKWVAERGALASVVDFRDYQLFEDATNYTCILTLSKKSLSEYEFIDAANGEIGLGEKRSAADLPQDGSTWMFAGGAEARLLKRLLDDAFPKLADIRARAFQGLRTSDNEVYVVQGAGKAAKGMQRIASVATGETHEIESSLLKPMLSGEDIRAFSLAHRDQWILFPYDIGKEGATLFSEKDLRTDFPGAWRYFKACESRLRARERGRMDEKGWWAYGRTQNLDQFEQPKVMLPGFNDSPAAAYDSAGIYYHVSGYSLTLSAKSFIDLKILAALLNSRLLFWTLLRVGVALQRGFVEFRPQYLDQLPIVRPTTKQASILRAIADKGAKHGYESVAAELDGVVYELYGLSAEEISVVEGRLGQRSSPIATAGLAPA
jgi:hypothetical protein